jgi:PhzF family phenazine biosynthesis protein
VSRYYHVDVFSSRPAEGNGLAVVFPDSPRPSDELLKITREFNQFESIFLTPGEEQHLARIFTRQEELPFAGHPLLGAAAVIHRRQDPGKENLQVSLTLGHRAVELHSECISPRRLYRVTLDQGPPLWGESFPPALRPALAQALGLEETDILTSLPLRTVSTGLPYLLIPVTPAGLEKMSIRPGKLEGLLHQAGAHFTYLFDPAARECRSWDNQGTEEDAATGSAAGPLIAYLNREGLIPAEEVATLHQGRFVHRPSTIEGWITRNGSVMIRGSVAFFAEGELTL